MRIKIACADCGELTEVTHCEGIEDDDVYCEDCDQNRSERAWERQCERFYGGETTSLRQQQIEARRLK